MTMSYHIHQVSTDSTGDRSAFIRDAMREISRARNHDLRRRDSLWDGRPFGDTALLVRDTIERKLLYTWLNPVKAGLVRRAEQWPGVKILPRHLGKTLRMKRRGSYYGRRSPEHVEFTPMPPPGYDDMSLKVVRKHFQKLLRDAEDELHKNRRRTKYKGAVSVCRVDPFSCPRSKSPIRCKPPDDDEPGLFELKRCIA